MTDTNAPRQLRLIIETDDFAGTLRFYRDVLGMPEQVAHAGGGDERVAILLAGTGTIEIASPSHARRIDEVEGVPGQASTMRLALEVDDARRAVAASSDAGSAVLGTPRETPFRSLNARIQGPAGWQITLFQELETVEQRRDRPGFARDDDRER